MKFIDKEAADLIPPRLTTWKAFHHTALNELYRTASGSDIWEYLDNRGDLNTAGTNPYSKRELKQSLLEDQGYICCYCGKRIENDSTTPIEHLNPKSIYKNRTYDYTNLLASCDGGSSHKIHLVKTGETLASIASDYGVSEDDLIDNYINVETSEHIRKLSQLYDIENLQIGDRLFIIPKLPKDFQHCDTKKGGLEIPLKPTQSNIEAQFTYLPDGMIDVSDNELLEDTVNKLGLNQAPLLIAERKEIVAAAIRKKSSIFLACKKDPVSYRQAIRNLCPKYYTKDTDGKLAPYTLVLGFGRLFTFAHLWCLV